ncbi:TetR family transcriptional regulator [Aeromicrobium sp. Leaf350]|uniref:TetR family transcriptional regulator n=1 Tax=Aeromicrobium sp. Leaf350 TaxID=2876565 RepID=UPI001E2D4ED4|nr:TetR family transcriptional regulator [Aeromicrobium sp. Leaf350]
MPAPADGRATANHSDGTRARIVAAALEEFSQHGIAGARIDRIAKRARTSKERLYAYFRSKTDLYQQTVDRELVVLADVAPMNPSDLPAYAGALFDYFSDNPERFRLIAWGRLESDFSLPGARDSFNTVIQSKIARLALAQQDGDLSKDWDPIDILALVNQLAATWASQPDLQFAATSAARNVDRAARRAAVISAVQAVFPARASG